jgi:MerR family transcriptional regulator, light-induced transcriptional regulator
MNEIGLLWQADTISPAHEHFISFLFKQKLLINTEKLQTKEPTKTDRVFVLFLPMNEIHELGLMYVNYEVLFNGYKAVYLGESVPFENLLDVKKYFNNITFVSYLTVEPNKDEINNFVSRFNKELLNDKDTEVWFLGRMLEHLDKSLISDKTKVFYSIESLIENF